MKTVLKLGGVMKLEKGFQVSEKTLQYLPVAIY